LSRTLSDLNAKVDRSTSEKAIRAGIGKILPDVANLPATWHDCIVAFSADSLPVVGEIGDRPGLHVFSGLSNPLAIVPALAERFANWAAGEKDWAMAYAPLRYELLSPDRFAEK